MRHLRAFSVLCAALVVALAACGGDEQARPDLVFVSTRDGDYAIFEMNADGGAQHRLTPRDGDVSSSPARLFFQIEPAWSPDAARIAFASRRSGTFDVYVMNADGTGTEQLTSGKDHDSHPTWSSDGARIAFERGSDIWIMNADGSGARRVSDVTAEESEPTWSPDGEWIAYVRRTPGTAARELWLMRADGSARRALTSLGATVATPAWSPDSARIVFASNQEDEVYKLFTIGLDGKGLRSVAPTAKDNFEPSWSPDGDTIAYFEDGAILAVELGGGEIEKLTDSANNDSSPAWNPQPPPAEE
ncbi:MAG TPA: DPP IV N-terminal domain-containing protein [Gaiellaceae bacterium]|nr:DPP IV N-terminal domain-containing protein [Gaiellaceae bacterium]